MRLSGSFATALLLVALAAPAWPTGHSNAGLKQTMQQIYARMDRAVDRRDFDGFVAFYDPDYREMLPNNMEREYQAFVARTAAVFSHASKINARSTVLSAQQTPDGVTVTVRVHLTGVFKNPKNGKKAAVDGTEVDRDFWVNDSGSWKLKQERALSSTGTVNGKRVR